MSISKEFVLKRILEDPEIRYYDVKYQNKKDVLESSDSCSTNIEAHDRLRDLLDNLQGVYYIILRKKSRLELKEGGSTKSAGEYMISLGTSGNSPGYIGSVNPQSSSSYLDKYLSEREERLSREFEHRLMIMQKDQEIAKLRSKKEDSGISGALENTLIQVLTSHYLKTPGATQINGTELPTQTRWEDVLKTLQEQNPEALSMLENLSRVLALYPGKISGFNQALEKAATGENLLTSFMAIV